jgi:hypothetical protein
MLIFVRAVVPIPVNIVPIKLVEARNVIEVGISPVHEEFAKVQSVMYAEHVGWLEHSISPIVLNLSRSFGA